MTSTLTRRQKPVKTYFSAQELIKTIDVVKIGLLRKKRNSKFGSFGKWPHKFVVLAKESIYIYDHENSNKPNSNISLVGYNSVIRSENRVHEWGFSVMPAKEFRTVKIQTFACVSDSERKSWMKSIRNQIYEANNIEKPTATETKMLEVEPLDDPDSDADYIQIEEMVYGPDQAPDILECSDSDESDSELEEAPRLGRTSRSNSLPYNSLNYTDASSSKSFKSKSSYDDATSTGLPLPRPQEKSTSKSHAARFFSDPSEMFPPRYSAVCEGDAEEEALYVNCRNTEDPYDSPFSNISVSLEAMCTITDKNPDRENLNKKLVAKREPGTYLIRKSRSGDDKVLSFLTDKAEVKEYKIYNTNGKVHVNPDKHFDSIDELLEHYTSVEPLINPEYFLRKGFYSVTGHISDVNY